MSWLKECGDKATSVCIAFCWESGRTRHVSSSSNVEAFPNSIHGVIAAWRGTRANKVFNVRCDAAVSSCAKEDNLLAWHVLSRTGCLQMSLANMGNNVLARQDFPQVHICRLLPGVTFVFGRFGGSFLML